jgi:glycosyltransferase involved in cell wall biosynthesis
MRPQAMLGRPVSVIDGTFHSRVLLFSMGPLYGGAETYYVKLVRLLSGHYELRAVVADQRLYDELLSLNVPTEKITPFVAGKSILRYPEAVFTLARTIRVFKPDCVHLNGQAESYLGFVPAGLGVATVSTRHTAFDQNVSAFKRTVVTRNLRRVGTTICVSSVLKHQLEPEVGEQRLVTIPNWIDPLPLVLPYNPPKVGERLRLLYVGRIVQAKGIFDLIKALQALEDVCLDVVGDGEDLKNARAHAKDLPITFHGFQSDCSPFYRRAHLFVFPSHPALEGHPQAPIEAMAHGLPSLLSNIPVNEETVDRGRAAELFQWGDVDDLTEKIRALQNDPLRLHEFSKRGVEHVHLRFSKERAREQYFKVFDNVIGKL